MMMFESLKYRQTGKIGQDKGRRIPSTGWALVQRHSYNGVMLLSSMCPV